MSGVVRRDVVILACAVSAGTHAALAPAHPGFVGAAGVLGMLALALTLRPDAELLHGLAALTFGGLIASYGLAATTGLPILHPEPEPVDALGLATKAVEAAGLVAATTLIRPLKNRSTRWTGPPARFPSS